MRYLKCSKLLSKIMQLPFKDLLRKIYDYHEKLRETFCNVLRNFKDKTSLPNPVFVIFSQLLRGVKNNFLETFTCKKLRIDFLVYERILSIHLDLSLIRLKYFHF